MKGSPLVTIIVPVYNAEKYLERCLNSIVNQTYRNLEILLINDGSTDSSEEICSGYAQKDKRIQLFRQENQGQAAARNTGLDHMTGDYVAFVDADDYIALSYVEILLSNLIEQGVRLAVCDYEMRRESDADQTPECGDQIVSVRRLSQDDVYGSLKHWRMSVRFTVLWGKLYAEEIFRTLRLPVGKNCEDEIIFHKVYEQIEYVCCIEKKLYYYVQGENSVMRHIDVVQRYEDAIGAFRQRLEYFQSRGKTKYARITAIQMVMFTKSLYEQSGEEEEQVRKHMRVTMDEAQRMMGRKIFLPEYLLYVYCPVLYHLLRAGYRMITNIVKD